MTFSGVVETREYKPEKCIQAPQTAHTRSEKKKIDAILRGACSICDPSANVKDVCDACAMIQKKDNEKLHADGFIVFRNAFDIDDNTRSEVDDTIFKPIFNGVAENGELTYDGKRLQGTGEWRQKIKRQLNRFLFSKGILSNHRRMSELYALRSLPNCGQQPRHTDSAPEKSLLGKPAEDIPLAMIYALEDRTRLKIWSFNNDYNDFCVINLKKSDMIVFRGDMAHCGFEYKQMNTRIHAYIDSNKDGCKRQKGLTWVNGSSEVNK